MKRKTAKGKQGTKVEYLIALEDGTWTTRIVQTPLGSQDEQKALAWANKKLTAKVLGDFLYSRVVLFAVYGFPAQEE
jgi:hypothetical protein